MATPIEEARQIGANNITPINNITPTNITPNDIGVVEQPDSKSAEDVTPVSLLSTDNAIKNIEEFKVNIDNEVVEPVEPVKPIEPVEPVEPVEKEEPAEGTYTVEQLVEIGITDLSNFDETGINTGKYRPNEQGWEQLGASGVVKPESIQLAKEQAEFDAAKQDVLDLKDTINAYDVLQDTKYQGQAKLINAQFDKLIKNMEQVNKSRQAGFEQIGMRTGATRYTSSSMKNIIGEEINQGVERIGELERQRTSALLAAQTSYENRQWTKFAQDYKMLKDIKEDEQKELDNFAETLLARNKKIEEEEKADKLRTGILEAMNQGFTDPLDILSALQQVGIEADPEDVTKYTNLIQNEDWMSKLDGGFETYELYKKNQPELLESMGITNPFEWMRAVGNAGRKAVGGGGGGGGVGAGGDVIPTNINEAIDISAQQLVDRGDVGKFSNDLVYKQYIDGLMADWGVPEEQRGDVKSLLNRTMEKLKGESEIGSDFETFVSAPIDEFETGAGQAGQAVGKGIGAVGKAGVSFLKDFIPSLIALTGETGAGLTNFVKGIIGDKDEVTENEKQKVYKALGVTK